MVDVNKPQSDVAALSTPRISDVTATVRSNNPAENFYNNVHQQILEIKRELQPGESVILTHGGATGPCAIDNVGFHGTDMLVLSGLDTHGRHCRLLVHLHAVNLAMTIVPKDERSRPIGFSGEVVAAGESAENVGQSSIARS